MEVIWLKHETVHEISIRSGITVQDLMGMLARSDYDKVAYHFVFAQAESETYPVDNWRVLDGYRQLVMQADIEEKARRYLMDGYILEREYVTEAKSTWRKVD